MVIGHLRAAAKLLGGQRDIPVKLWVAPPTKMDESEPVKEGHYASFGAAGARAKMPGWSLCVGKNTNMYLDSAELAGIASNRGRAPTVLCYHVAIVILNEAGAAICSGFAYDLGQGCAWRG